jgi:hypothetical protein
MVDIDSFHPILYQYRGIGNGQIYSLSTMAPLEKPLVKQVQFRPASPIQAFMGLMTSTDSGYRFRVQSVPSCTGNRLVPDSSLIDLVYNQYQILQEFDSFFVDTHSLLTVRKAHSFFVKLFFFHNSIDTVSFSPTMALFYPLSVPSPVAGELLVYTSPLVLYLYRCKGRISFDNNSIDCRLSHK